MTLENYTLIGPPMTREEFKNKLERLTKFETSDGVKYEVQAIKRDVMELRIKGNDPLPIRFINIRKLYRHYSMIAEKSEGKSSSRPAWGISDLAVEVMLKMKAITR